MGFLFERMGQLLLNAELARKKCGVTPRWIFARLCKAETSPIGRHALTLALPGEVFASRGKQ
jgi:hypothetical protein